MSISSPSTNQNIDRFVDQYPKYVPESFMCAISGVSMTDPYIHLHHKCNNSFEKKKIEEWILKKPTCPKCRREVAMKDFAPNHALRNSIEEFCSQTIPRVLLDRQTISHLSEAIGETTPLLKTKVQRKKGKTHTKTQKKKEEIPLFNPPSQFQVNSLYNHQNNERKCNKTTLKISILILALISGITCLTIGGINDNSKLLGWGATITVIGSLFGGCICCLGSCGMTLQIFNSCRR